MVLINEVRQKTYKFKGVQQWEEYLDNMIDEEAENGLNSVTVLRTPDFKDMADMNEYNIHILKTVMSMYKHEGFKLKIKWKQINHKKTIAGLKISW